MITYFLFDCNGLLSLKKEISRLMVSWKPDSKNNLESFAFELFFNQNEPIVAKNLDQKGNKGKFISNFKSGEIKNSVTCVFTMTITSVIIANTKSVVETKKRKK